MTEGERKNDKRRKHDVNDVKFKLNARKHNFFIQVLKMSD